MDTTLNTLEIEPLSILKEAISLVDLIPQWDADKTYPFQLKSRKSVDVQTCHKYIGDVRWSARSTSLSKFPELSKQEIWNHFGAYLVGEGSTHTKYEQQYIHELESYKVEDCAEKEVAGYSYSSYAIEAVYKLQFPLKKRVFYELVLVYKLNSADLGYVVSIPIEPKLFGSPSLLATTMVLARYASVEKVKFDKQTGSLDWIMCTRSSPGGSIPDFLANMSINGVISKDVPSFLDWAASQ